MLLDFGGGDQMLTAKQLAQVHRRNTAEASGIFSDSVPTIAAILEHLAWRAGNPGGNVPDLTGDLWQSLGNSPWPSRQTRDITRPHWGVRILPPEEDMIILRSVEAELRRKMENHAFTPSMAKAIAGATSEVINNVWEHAATTLPAILVYQLRDGVIDAGVADTGIGVLNSLKTNPAYRGLTTSMEALKKAMVVGVTRFPDKGRGYGFDTVLRAVADHWGAVRLRSGQAILELNGSAHVRTAVSSYGVPLPGLQVALSCSTVPRTSPVVL